MKQTEVSRRSFLRGNRQFRQTTIFPPWSIAKFTDHCRRCDDCITACDENILFRGDGGFPNVDFSQGACSFCRDCVDACQYAALDKFHEQPWNIKAKINTKCFSLNAVVCRSCGDACEQRAINFRLKTGGRALPVINTNACNGCGACFSVCPANAIQIEEVT